MLALIAFGTVAVGAFGILYWNVITCYRMSGWDEVPARLTSVNLSSRKNQKGSNSYRAEATYDYQYRGQAYSGDRVGIHTWGHDGFRGWQRNTATRLRKYQKQRQPCPCFVNPSNPAQSVLDREMRPSIMLLVTVFAGIFGGIGLSEVSRWRAVLRRDADPQNSASTSEQLSNEFCSAPIDSVWRWLPAFFFFALLAAPTAILLPSELRAGNAVAILLSIVPAITFLIVLICCWAVFRQLIEGTTIVKLASVPGVIGGHVSGVVCTKRDLSPGTVTVIKLRCDETKRKHDQAGHQRKSHSGTQAVMHWSDEQELAADLTPAGGDGSAIPFDFFVPDDLPETQPGKVQWVITARSNGRGPRFQSQCEIPVFITKDSGLSRENDESLVAALQGDLTPQQRLRSHGVRFDDKSDGSKRLRIRGQMSFVPMAVLAATMIATDVACFALFHRGASWLLVGVVGILGALLTWGFLHTLMWGCRIVVTEDSAQLRSGATLFCGSYNIRRADFCRLYVRMGTQIGNAQYYKVYLATDEHAIHVGKGILGKERAELYGEAIWHEVVGTDPPPVEQRSFSDEKRERARRRSH
ncbi:DUF3592 domain-containing protein [Neorhodopirellula pilleata]|nr:DUF3592 domain-containing protein [Neorhodopirellula pilleata]